MGPCDVAQARRGQVQAGLSIRECANDAGASSDLKHDSFERVASLELDPMAVGETVVGQRLMAVLFEQLGRFGQLHCAEIGDHRLHLLSRCLAILLGVEGVS